MQSKKFTELKDHEIAILITALRDTALRYHDHQSLRERIAHLVVPALKGEGLPREARLHGFDAGRRVDGTNAASADKQQRPFPSRTAGEVESTTGFHVMESAGAKEVIDTLVADALMAASQGNASNVGDVLADSVERPDVDPIRHVSNDGQTGAN